MPQTGPATLFLSYAHEDEPFCQELKKHLRLLERQNLLSAWYDRQIIAGASWSEEIDRQLEQAQIIVLLISADFLASDYCYSTEMQRALARHQAGEARMIPILIRPCDWSLAPFARMQQLPTDARPISTWQNQDEAWTNVVTNIRLALDPSSKSTEPVSPRPRAPALPRKSSSSTLDQRNRAHFLAKLRNSYRDRLDASLQGAAQIALALQKKLDTVPNQMHLRHPHQPEQPWPTGTTLLQVFDNTSGELLVLGSPGSGKTTLLLNLAEALEMRAEQDEHALIPVIVNLSTWATTRNPLSEWLIEEIMKSYQVPRGPITRWVQQNQILPLLDGLDEVDSLLLPTCIEAINTYKQQHLLPLVVCSRTADYERSQSHLILQNAVVIQSLSAAQVDAYFKAAGESLSGIRAILRQNAELRELVSTPLMLHVVTLTYRDSAAQALPKQGAMQEQQQQIFELYVEHMLSLPHTHFSSQRMICSLSWLARQMRTHNQTVFYLEHLQPEWLPTSRARRIYNFFAVRCYGVVLGLLVSLLMYAFVILSGVSFSEIIWFGLTGGLVGGLISGNEDTTFQFSTIIESWKRQGKKLALLSGGSALCIGVCTGYAFSVFGYGLTSLYGYIFGLGAGLCAFLLCNIIGAGKWASRGDTVPLVHYHTWWKRWLPSGLRADHLRLGAIVGVLFGLSYGLINGLINGLSYGLINGLIDGLINGLIYGLSGGLRYGLSFGCSGILLSLLLFGTKQGIALTEIIIWSLSRLVHSLSSKAHLMIALRLFLLTGLFFGLSSGLSSGLKVGLIDGLIKGLNAGLSFGLLNGLSFGLSFGLSSGLIYWLLLGMWNSFSQEILADHHRSTPNQGVKRSIRNGTLLGLEAGILCGFVLFFTAMLNAILSSGLTAGLISEQLNELINGLIYKLNDLSIGLSYGLLAAITGGLLVWFVTGGLAGVRHLLLRIQLARAGLLPFRAIYFLNEATRCILLYRDGGGYRFIHRLLLDYLADRDPISPIRDDPATVTF